MPSRSRLSRPESNRHTKALTALLCIGIIGMALFAPVALALPPFAALQVVFRRVMYPFISGAQGQISRETGGVYFALVLPVVAILLIVFYRRMMRASADGTYIGRAAKSFGLMVFAIVLLNVGVQAGLGIPFAIAYAALLALLWWHMQQFDWVRRVVGAVVWMGMGFLVASGSSMPFVQGATRFDFQRLHGIYGYLWLSVVGAYLVEHITYYEAKRETWSRNWGYLAAAMLSAATLTGVARLHGGGETWASGLWPHVVPAALAAASMAAHVGWSWKKRGLRIQSAPGHGSGIFILGFFCLGLMLPVLPLTLRYAPEVRGVGANTACGRAELATPEIGLTASGPNGACLPAAFVGIQASATSCGKNGGCHVDVQAQWERSAHRFSANPAYRQTVRLLIRDEGIERARLCAGCHDPVPLLAGRIVEGSGYPDVGSEGVTCVVCHSMQPAREAKNGHYTVSPSSVFEDSVKDPFTAYMMIVLYRESHRSDLLGATLTDNSMCAPCHSLTHRNVVLRRTFEEWSEGPFGPNKGKTKLCTSCHMPVVGPSYLDFDLHDHRMEGSNIALAGLRSEFPEAERAFIASALDLQISLSRRAPDGVTLHARLANKGGGHLFPTAPHDLLDYWFEVQFEGRNFEPTWQRLEPAGLFPEKLISQDGEILTRHEIWRAAKTEGPEGIPPGSLREYAFPLPEAPAGVERITVRLMHRRYQDAFLRFLGAEDGGLYTDSLEVLRRTIEWRPDSPAQTVAVLDRALAKSLLADSRSGW